MVFIRFSCLSVSCLRKVAGALLAGLLPLAAIGQILTGTITAGSASGPVPYANLGIPGKTVGTVTDEHGRYQLAYMPANLTDTVYVSSLGYRPQRVLLRELVAQPNRALTAVAVPLADVRVQGAGFYKRRRTLGCTSTSHSIISRLKAEHLGAEVGMVVSLKHKPTKLLTANFNVLYYQPDTLRFRVNLYRLLPDGSPSGEKLLTRNLLVSTADRATPKGPLTVDLTTDQLVIEEDFLLTLEWISGGDVQQVSKNLGFSSALGYGKGDLYFRKTSQDTWEKPSLGARLAGMQPKVGFYVTALD
ncbi:carboxypeptidase-like regulatory domain-containing protein [Hymenobacter endophyticus]|uniref:Carboxypeptidase-like regulatory domain-containing protein n=1 Tax=Hymenobacter endophyticus TaxID=3076335 RepID=A0ABU3TEJ4_9BACT|nr:carboxypeptidase-like regulatory domain-containing protein [Hymenobacter endophyticus]MDU0369797.1 carboxypeptidase-like regulatory domain-containing protein [Hymenobacter endophyticus]